jgi:glycosyltransferase involved in cell wall biosynthesis
VLDLVSILIPAYNSEKWIGDTIQSAINQTWTRKEIIIVDDGSLDNTLKIAREYESKNIKVLSQENRGAASARNKAYSLAQGDYIQWLDSDDLLAQNKISEQMKVVKNDRTGLILISASFGLFYWR